MKRKTLAVIIILSALTVLLSVSGLMSGSVRLSLREALSGLFTGEGSAGVIVGKLRLPRVLGALLSGIALSTAGVLLQSATGNDLCSPNVTGMNAGSGLLVMAVLCFLPSLIPIIPVFAFFGSLLAVTLVILIGESVPAYGRKTTVILAGVAVGALFNAGISFLSQAYPDVLGSYVFFSTGGFSGVRLSELPVPALIILLCFVLSFVLAPSLELFCLGDELAANSGVNVRRTRISALLLASALTAASVSYAGLLGFVGLIVPHMAGRLVGRKIRLLLPVSALAGASLCVLSDLLGRTLFAPSEVSAGVFLNLLGAPFFIFLLLRRKKDNA
ncbi:MAG: iron ABC transporter permease [Clostridia bacterium]|nr:iron ABC transporter permease [Clostridia bacterium]